MLRERTDVLVAGGHASDAADAPRLDSRAFARLVDRFHAPVYGYLSWLSRDATAAADLAEEVFLRLWQHPPDPRRSGSHRAYVLRIALNVYRQHLRRCSPVPDPIDEVAEALPDPGPGPLTRLAREQLRSAVRDAVLQLPDLQREVIALHNLEGLTLREVAEALEVPLGTVKSRLASAFVMLRRHLAEWEGDRDEMR